MNRVRACLDNDRGQEEAIATLMTVPGLGFVNPPTSPQVPVFM